MKGLLHDRNFLLIQAATLISATGSFMLLLAVSAELLRRSGSGLGAASVFAFQWILPVLAVSAVRRIADLPGLRRVLVLAELAGGTLSLAIGLLLTADLLPLVLGCFLLRGFGEAVTRTGRVVLLRRLFDGPRLAAAASSFNIAFYTGATLGGVAGGLVVGRLSLTEICALDAASFVVAALCWRALPDARAAADAAGRRGGALREALRMMAGNPALLRQAGYVVLSTGIFQGFHNAARTLLPMRGLGLDDRAVMHLQVASGLAIILGAVLVPLLGGLSRRRWLTPCACALACLLLAAASRAPGLGLLIAAYLAFLVAFELAFTAAQAGLIQAATTGQMATMQAAANAGGTALVILVTLATGGLADLMPMAAVGPVIGILGLMLIAGLELAARRARAMLSQAMLSTTPPSTRRAAPVVADDSGEAR
ncbi:MFS transporter [Tistrella mobilis]|uniref:MFS transporter n=1 Tax=Tistrella mobilis TaxID=171437 RepID=UPI003555C0AE